MTPMRFVLLSVLLIVTGLTACREEAPREELVIYSGRSQSLVDALIDQFEQETGISVSVRYGDTAQLVAALDEEGMQTRADLFWAQDAGALGATHGTGLLAPLPDTLLAQVPDRFQNEAGTWVATSGRARTLAYAPARVDTNSLPRSVFDLTAPQYRGRVGWAPTNGSFQAFVTGMRKLVGEERTRAWLRGMKANEAKSYANNTAIVQAIADGEIDFGLPNHYYLYRFKSEDPAFPVEQTFFQAGDPGDLINVSGIGILKTSTEPEVAARFIAFLLSEPAQQYFAEETYEYPVVENVTPDVRLVSMDRIAELQPDIDLDALRDLEGTLELMRQEGLL